MIPVTDHAVRRYGERKLGIFADGRSDPEYLNTLRSMNIDVDGLRSKLSKIGDLGLFHGAPAVIAEGVKLVIKDRKVVTVLEKNILVSAY